MTARKKGFGLQSSGIGERINAIPVTDPIPGDVKKIGVEDVVVRPQVRERFDEQALKDLVAVIKRDGQRQPVECYFENGKYYLLTGERRYRAVKQLGWPMVEIKIRAKPKPVEMIYLQLSENEDREELTRVEFAKAIASLSQLGVSNRDIARNLRINEKQVPRYRTVGRAGERVHALYDAGVVDLRSLELMTHIEAGWGEVFDEIAAAVVAGSVGRNELESLYSRLKNGESSASVVSISPQDGASQGPGEQQVSAGIEPVTPPSAQAGQESSEAGAPVPIPRPAMPPESASEGASGANDGDYQGDEGGGLLGAQEGTRKSEPLPKPGKAAISIDHHYEATHVASDPGRIVIEVKGKLDNGTSVNGTLLMDRVDERSEYVWVKPDSQEAEPVKLHAKKIKVVSVTDA